MLEIVWIFARDKRTKEVRKTKDRIWQKNAQNLKHFVSVTGTELLPPSSFSS